jgi:hypothetical protein
MTQFQELLKKLSACQGAREWAGEKTFSEVWATCQRGDWMLWLAQKVGVDKRTLTLAKARCAELVLHLMTDERSRDAVAMALRYGHGEATDEELSDAASASAAAYAYAAAYAAYASAYASAAAYVAYAAYASASAAKAATLQKCAEITREVIPMETMKKLINP